MLRGRPEKPVTVGAEGTGTSIGPEEPYSTEERPPGIAFYKGKESFFFPYALLESMQFQAGKITLSFAPAIVVVESRGLHRIYALLAAQKISRLVEQGERHEEAFETTLYVRRIDEIPKGKPSKDGDE